MTDVLTRPDIADRDARLQVLGVAAHLAEHFDGVEAGGSIGDGVVAIAEKLQAFVDGRTEAPATATDRAPLPDAVNSLLEDERTRAYRWRDRDGDVWVYRGDVWAIKASAPGGFTVPPHCQADYAFAPYRRVEA